MTDQNSSTSTEIIPFATRQLGTEAVPTVDARDLHAFLGVKARFNDWIARRIDKYGFVQDIDFTCYSLLSNGPKPAVEYHISFAMAKELSMVEKTEKGKEARLYFLECERRTIAQAGAEITLHGLHTLLGQVVQAFPMVLQTMQGMAVGVQALSLQVETQSTELVRLAQRVEQVEAAQDKTPGYMTLMGFARLKKFRLTLTEARKYGQQLRKKAREAGVTLGKTPDERWGTVNSYPVELLDELFAPLLQAHEVLR